MQTNIMSCRLVKESTIEYEPIRYAEDAITILRQIDNLTMGTEEYVYLLCLNNRNEVLGVHELSHGDLSTAIVSPRAIFIRAVLQDSSHILLVHSHCSHNPEPSTEDKEVTERVKKAGDIVKKAVSK